MKFYSNFLNLAKIMRIKKKFLKYGKKWRMRWEMAKNYIYHLENIVEFPT